MCNFPLKAYKPVEGGKLSFSERSGGHLIEIGCNHCTDCRISNARELEFLLTCESRMHDDACFITLTYRDEDEPMYGSLHYPDVQAFLRRVRRRFPGVKLVFVCRSEYGPDTDRPHYHLILFGVGFRDGRVPVARGESGHTCFSTPLLSELWPHGFASVGDVTPKSCAYVARYHIDKVNGPLAAAKYTKVLPSGEVVQLEPELTRRSLRPGIGATFFDKYFSQYSSGFVFTPEGKFPLPRYWWKLYERRDPHGAPFVRWERARLARARALTPARLEGRERAQRSRLDRRRRGSL